MNTIHLKFSPQTNTVRTLPASVRSRLTRRQLANASFVVRANWATLTFIDPDFVNEPTRPINPYAKGFLALWLLGFLTAIGAQYIHL